MRPDATAKVQHASKHATLLSKRHAAEMSKLIRVKKKNGFKKDEVSRV